MPSDLAPAQADVSFGPSGVDETPAHLTPAGPAPAEATSLRRNRDFLAVLLGQGVSSFGDAITNGNRPGGDGRDVHPPA